MLPDLELLLPNAEGIEGKRAGYRKLKTCSVVIKNNNPISLTAASEQWYTLTCNSCACGVVIGWLETAEFFAAAASC